jgi:ribose transport system permease protein
MKPLAPDNERQPQLPEPAPVLQRAENATVAERFVRWGGRPFVSEVATALVLFALSAVLIVGSRAISPAFGSWNQVIAILVLSSVVMVVAFGQQMVILIGGLDLSVGSMMSLGGVLLFGWLGISPAAIYWGIPAALAVTGLLGAFNGVGIAS